MSWIILAFINAVAHSINQAFYSKAAGLKRFSRLSLSFYTTAMTAGILFGVSWFVGFPAIHSDFLKVIIVTGIINFIALPILLKGYEIGEFSSVYSMILLTPIFLIGTAYFILGEAPSGAGIIGIIATIVGLGIVGSTAHDTGYKKRADSIRGNVCGVIVALLYAVTVNFDKLSGEYSDQFFAGAALSAVVALLSALYIVVTAGLKGFLPEHGRGVEKRDITVVGMAGVTNAVGLIFHISALLGGLASYTIAFRRTGVLFGMLWGRLFFHETISFKKIVGVLIAIGGVLCIIFFG